jgi:predicted RNA-binding protein Jag
MSANFEELKRFISGFKKVLSDCPEFISQAVIGEGINAVKNAKRIATTDPSSGNISKIGVVNSGAYCNAFHAGNQSSSFNGKTEHDGEKPTNQAGQYVIDVYNNMEYAAALEYGFRAHFVPGHWKGHTFVYQKDDPQGGMFVGKKGQIVQGHHTLERALGETKSTQKARLQRKLNKFLKERLTP